MSSDSPPPKRSSEESARDHHGSLRSKLVLSLAAMFFVFLTIDEMVRDQVIRPEFAALERSGAIRDANRVVAAMNAKVEHLCDLAKHWANRLHRNPLDREQVESSRDHQDRWSPENLEWAAIISSDGDWRWLHKSEGPSQGSDASDPDRARFDAIAEQCRRDRHTAVSGMTRLADSSLVMFAAVPIDGPREDQPPRGGEQNSPVKHPGEAAATRHLVVGRTVDQEMVVSLRQQTQVDFSLQTMRTHDPNKRLAIWEADEKTLVVEIQLTGVDEQELANVFVQVPREITAHAEHTTSMARNSFVIGAIGALMLLLLFLQRIVIGPLTAIRKHSDRVAEHGFNIEPLVIRGDDEIGELAEAFDHMMHRLGDAQTQLAEASRAAGRSQVASTVIHNVGNVLTNVNSLLDVVTDRVDGMRLAPLSKLADRLAEEENNGALMAATPKYLKGLATTLESDRETISEMMSTLHDNIRHIHDVIRDQQRHTGHDVQRDAVALIDVVNEAIGCCHARLRQDAIEVEVCGCLDVQVHSDRSLLLQSVINIIGNARYALREMDGEARKLEITAVREEGTIKVRFTDNGIGMTSETREKVFDAHFTTRGTGSGLGLHFCANAIDRLGGTIYAESDGPGKGATFVVELPLYDPTPLSFVPVGPRFSKPLESSESMGVQA